MFRFTTRDVLWLTVVVALACGWWTEHRSYERRLAEQQATHRSDVAALKKQIEAVENAIRTAARHAKR